MANPPLRRLASAATAKPPVKGLSKSTQWSSLAMLGGEEGDQVYVRNTGEDWLSGLPDDVLVNIAERLSIADAARTSILSRRWSRVPAMLSEIHITVGCVDPEHDRVMHGVGRANAAVLRATVSLLQSRSTSPHTIRLLGVQFFLGHGCTKIGQTVADAVATHKVGSTELTILTNKETERCTAADMVANGRQLCLFVKYCPAILSGLTRLKLENVRLPKLDFPTLFGLCKELEFLRLDSCDMLFTPLLQVEHPRLRELEILRSNFERVDLRWLPELTTLTFSRWVSQHVPMCFGYVPLLHMVSISNTASSSQKMLKLSEFLGKATISNLHLNFQSGKIWVKPEDPIELSQVFNKLRLVNLAGISEECDLTWTMFVLQGAPSLEELCIKVCGCLGTWEKKPFSYRKEKKVAGANWEASASDFKHHCLSVLRIIGFQSEEDKFVNYITAVMKSAVNLKDIYLHKKPVCEKCMYNHRQKDKYPRTKTQRILVSNSICMDAHPLLTLHFPSLREQCYGPTG